MNELNNYSDYKSTVLKVISYLKKISEINESLAIDKGNKSIQEAIERLENDTFNIAVVGEFNRGKSSVINALLGKKNVLPVSIMPCTAVINKITYGIVPYAEVFYEQDKAEEQDGKSEKQDDKPEKLDLTTGSDILKQYLTKLTEESSAKAKTIKEVLIYYPVEYCRNGVTIIDTPGLNDCGDMTNITLSVLPAADVAIMVLMAKSPYSESENDFLDNKILASDLGRVIFVVNAIDQVESDEDKQRIIAEIRKRIETSSLKRVKAVYGEDSKEVNDYKNKLGNIKIFGLSARNAVKAKEEKNTELLQRSRFPEFEKELERFIVEERGVISLLNPINKLKTASIEIMRCCAERQAAMKMDLNEFVAKCNKAEQEINELREKQTLELSRISDSANTTYQNLMPEVNNFWSVVTNAVNNAIDIYPISNEDLKKENIAETQKNIIKEVQSTLEQTAQNKSEYIKECIVRDLQAETDRLSGFEKEFFEGIEKIQNCILPTDSLTSEDTSIISTSVVSFFTGALGVGIYQGFKKAGWKGALVGGVGGFAGGFAGAFAIVCLFPPAAAVTGILAVVAAVTGTFSAKWLLDKFFPSDKTERFRNAVKESVGKEITKLQSQNDYSKNVRKLVIDMFNKLEEKVRTETDAILSDTQSRLSKLKEDLAENKINKTAEIERMESIVEEVSTISSEVKTINDQLKLIIEKKQN